MKISIPEIPAVLKVPDVQVGNLYKAKGGSKTAFWLIIGVEETVVHLIGLNPAGQITQATTYGRHVFDLELSPRARRPVGFCPELQNLQLSIQWEDLP